MHHRAGRAIKAVLEGDVDEAVRNEAAFRLARIHFQKDQAADALTALDRISGKVPDAIRDDVEFLRANVYMALGRPADAAGVLKRLQGAQSLTGFAAYNLGIALLQEGREQDALAAAGSRRPAERERHRPARSPRQVEHAARQAAARVHRLRPRAALLRPRAPRRAVLEPGAAECGLGGRVGAELDQRAVVPWSILAKREVTDSAVQEALLALPYAYSKLDVHGRAAVLYGDALKSFGEELSKVDASIKSIATGAS